MHLEELPPGTVLTGTVHNVTDFGAFVDIGVKVNGLVHRSELSKKPIRHPMDAVSVGDHVTVVILSSMPPATALRSASSKYLIPSTNKEQRTVLALKQFSVFILTF